MRWYTVNHDGQSIKLPSVTTVLAVTMPAQNRATLTLAQAKNPLAFAQKNRRLNNVETVWIAMSKLA